MTELGEPKVSARRSVTARVLSLLATFDSAHRSHTLSELARCSDLPPATAHRLVSELVEWGALVRQHGGEYASAPSGPVLPSSRSDGYHTTRTGT